MFARWKAIIIVRRMIRDSETYIDQAKEEGFTSRNYYARAECALLALSVVFASIYTNKATLGKNIIKESISGSWRPFFSDRQKQEYKECIERLVAQYEEFIRASFSRTDLSKIEKLNTAYMEICKSLSDSFYSDFTPESEWFFQLMLINVRNYVAAIVGKK